VGVRQEVLRFLNDEGVGVGVPRLQAQFAALARAELTDLLQRYRTVWCARRRQSVRVLHWLVAGRAWTMDFAEPSLRGASWSLPAIDGRYPYLLAVRDLASGYQLCWLPVWAATAEVTMAALAVLFARYGAPLLLKSDNGPPFRAEEMKKFLQAAGVFPLFSPPYWPGYNGAIEAAIGSLKRRTEEHAVGQGHGAIWTAGDVEAARLAANANRPRRLHGLSPAEVWAQGTMIGAVERVRFEIAVEGERYMARTELKLDRDKDLDHWQQSAVDRKAIQRALVEHDYLLFRGRRVPLIVKAGKVTNFV
jgi:transposase InsO family protein